MTTILSVLANDFIIMASDSLATYFRDVVIANELKDIMDGTRHLETNTEDAIKGITHRMPGAHMTQVEKLFRIGPDQYPVGVSCTGRTSLGNRSVHSLVSEFGRTRLFQHISQTQDPPLESVAEGLHSYMREQWEKSDVKGELDLMLCGFEPGPEGISRPALTYIDIGEEKFTDALSKWTKPDIYWGGTFSEIERLIDGVELGLKNEINRVVGEIPEALLERINAHIEKSSPKSGPGSRPRPIHLSDLGNPDSYLPSLDDLPGYRDGQLQVDFQGISVQKAIDLVEFLLNVQIKSDEFSLRIPTVGGDLQLALITSNDFQWISKREWHLGSQSVERNE